MSEGEKRFVNASGKDVTVTLFIRAGDSPQDEGGTEAYDIAASGPNQEIHVIYEGEPGGEGYVFLNALLVEWAEGGDKVGVSRRVVRRGDAWDDTLNTNSTITIQSLGAGTFAASGSN